MRVQWVSVGYLNGVSIVQKILKSHASNKSMLYHKMQRSSSFEVQLYFDALVLLEECM